MIVVAIGAAALLGAVLLERGTRAMFAAATFARRNHRDQPVTTAVGLLVAVVVAGLGAVAAVVQETDLDVDDATEASLLLAAVLTVGYALLGLVDDVAGEGQSGGFGGHLRALAGGQISSGLLKWAGGASVALVGLGVFGGGGLRRLLTDAALIALSANLANLLDRRPGRTTKVAVLALGAVVAGAPALEPLAGPVAAVAAAAGLLPGELSERHMLGDSGSNAVGAAVGLAVVVTAGPTGRDVALLVVLALNLVSEAVSFSAVIDRVPPLRLLDRLGRRS